jgi:Tfp pilus assembly protein PilV
MDKLKTNKRGIVLIITLVTLLVVIILANIILGIISSQSRLTHHQISRIQAYYANRAAANYALEQLRTGAWPVPAAGSTATYTCNFTSCDFALSLATDFKPASITSMSLVITPAQSTDSTQPCYRNPLDTKACVTCTATYTYTAP